VWEDGGSKGGRRRIIKMSRTLTPVLAQRYEKNGESQGFLMLVTLCENYQDIITVT
jgi:hypothetical protein